MAYLVSLLKKGDTKYGALIALVLVMIVIVMGIPFITRSSEISERVIRDDVCRASVEAKAKFKTEITGSPLKLKCVEEEIVSKAKTKEAISLEITSEMYSCWYKYGEGNADWYDGWDFGGSDFNCKICSTVFFEEGEEIPTFGEFNTFLNKEKIPGKSGTFAQHFAGNENARLQFGGPGVNPSDKMDLSKSLYVVYTLSKFDENRVNELREIYSQSEGNVVFGARGLTNELGGAIDPEIAVGSTFAIAGSILLYGASLTNPIGWALILGGVTYAIVSEGVADVPYYSLALLSAEDVAGMCNID